MGLTQKLGTIPLAIQTDSSNNVGIGGAANASYKLAVTGTTLTTGAATFSSSVNSGQIQATASGAVIQLIGQVGSNAYYVNDQVNNSGKRWRFGHTGAVSGYNSFDFYNQTDDRLVMTLSSGGNVGIGTSNPLQTATNRTVTTINGTNDAILNLATGGTLRGYIYVDSSSYTELYSVGQLALLSNASQPMTFATNGSERMRITANGEVLMNTSNTLTSGWLCISVPSNNYNAIVLRDSGTSYSSGNYYQLFTNSSNSIAGSISHPTSGTTSFNTSSDYRLKEDFKDFNGLDLLSNIKFYDFKWKEEDKRMHGVIAHELEPIIPLAVSGEKDAVDKEGNIVAQGVDYSKIVPVIGKALQEAMAKIDELNAKVTALENR